MKPSYISIDDKKDSLKLEHDQTVNGIPCSLSIDFIRTLRIPDDNNKYGLPPGLGKFPLKHVEDFNNLPDTWKTHGGIFLPMYQSEAMWLKFNSQWPFAIKIAAGKINAVSGEAWNPNLFKTNKISQAYDQLARGPETVYAGKIGMTYDNPFNQLSVVAIQPDYIVSPKQPWLDGFNVGKGLVRQFVAMPLGAGYTVEEQLAGKAEHGGIQIIAYPMKKEVWQRIQDEEKKKRENFLNKRFGNLESGPAEHQIYSMSATNSKSILRSKSVDMGLGAGGYMKQDIYEDPYEGDVWDTTKPLKVFVHLLNSLEYQNITGQIPPNKPLTPSDYKNYNYPWFDYYDDGKVLNGSNKLSTVDSIGNLQTKKDENVLGDNSSIQTPNLIHLGKNKSVKTGHW